MTFLSSHTSANSPAKATADRNQYKTRQDKTRQDKRYTLPYLLHPKVDRFCSTNHPFNQLTTYQLPINQSLNNPFNHLTNNHLTKEGGVK